MNGFLQEGLASVSCNPPQHSQHPARINHVLHGLENSARWLPGIQSYCFSNSFRVGRVPAWPNDASTACTTACTDTFGTTLPLCDSSHSLIPKKMIFLPAHRGPSHRFLASELLPFTHTIPFLIPYGIFSIVPLASWTVSVVSCSLKASVGHLYLCPVSTREGVVFTLAWILAPTQVGIFKGDPHHADALGPSSSLRGQSVGLWFQLASL